MTWRDHARCRGMDRDAFFAHPDTLRKLAGAVCDRCPVEDECLLDELVKEGDPSVRYGLRGGLLPGERALMFATSPALRAHVARVA